VAGLRLSLFCRRTGPAPGTVLLAPSEGEGAGARYFRLAAAGQSMIGSAAIRSAAGAAGSWTQLAISTLIWVGAAVL